MRNPVPYSDLFITPQSIQELADRIEAIGSPEEQRLVWLGAQYALNLAHHLVEELHVEEGVWSG